MAKKSGQMAIFKKQKWADKCNEKVTKRLQKRVFCNENVTFGGVLPTFPLFFLI